jgi:hypothetical protein
MSRVDKEERIQRIRIGLTGLAFVFLLVLLGTAISRSSDDRLPTQAENELMANQEPNEPLAEIGAAPGTGTSTNETAGQERAAHKKR